jgi:hypothetical protein
LAHEIRHPWVRLEIAKRVPPGDDSVPVPPTRNGSTFARKTSIGWSSSSTKHRRFDFQTYEVLPYDADENEEPAAT